MKKLLIILMLIPFFVIAQQTYVPDVALLISNSNLLFYKIRHY